MIPRAGRWALPYPSAALAPIGAALLIWASTQDWYSVPVRWNTATDSWDELRPKAEQGFHDLSGLMGLALLGAWIVGLCRSFAPLLVAAIGLMLVGLFPSAALVHDAEVGSAACWFERSHRSLVWLGGDIALSKGASEDLLGEDVLIGEQPVNFRTLPSPQRLTRDEPLSLLSPTVEWLGYGNAFAAFVKPGWFAAVLGFLLYMAGCVFAAPNRRVRIREGAGAVSAGLVATVALALVPVHHAARALDGAEAATAQGLHLEALDGLEACAAHLPLFAHDSHFVAQRGLLARRAGLAESSVARLYLARVRENQVTPAIAADSFREVLENPEISLAERREAGRALARIGANHLNTGLIERGRRVLEEAKVVLGADPKVEAALQLSWLREGELGQLEASTERVIALYDGVRLPSGAAVVALGIERLARGYLAAGDAEAAARVAARRGRAR